MAMVIALENGSCTTPPPSIFFSFWVQIEFINVVRINLDEVASF